MFRRTIYRITAVAVAMLAVLAGAGPAWAAPDPAPTDRINTIIGNITTWIVGLLIGVATLFLTIGGIRYLAAGGDPTEVEKAKSALKSALVGYALAILAPVLLGIVKGWIGG
jgi:succinate dehydrogenase/fumarate reductase cytochrome b subunit